MTFDTIIFFYRNNNLPEAINLLLSFDFRNIATGKKLFLSAKVFDLGL